MKNGLVKKAFPFAFDGITPKFFSVGDEFPPAGYKIHDNAFDGLVDAGYVEAVVNEKLPEDEELNRRLVEAWNNHLSAATDEDLKTIIARRGTPFSGNMVRAVLVNEAKTQMLAEMEGARPVLSVDPNSGVTEHPLSAPGQPAPPSAAAAMQAQQQQSSGEDGNKGVGEDGSDEKKESQASGENKATNQFGEPLQNGGTATKVLSEDELNGMTKAELEAYAKEKGIDVSKAKTKAEFVDALKPAA
ncbi:hypothetical protein LJR221_001439 [Agrobacterium tumefaciens]